MKAVISNPMAVKAAANVANGGYYLSFFQIRRVGDVAEVSGTNGYVVVIATVPAKFTRWGDGKSIILGGIETRSMMRGIGNAIKHAQQVSFERSAQNVSVSTVSDGATFSTSFDIDRCSSRTALRGSRMGTRGTIAWSASAEPASPSADTAIDPYMIATACNAIKALAVQRGYRLSLHGEYGAIEFKMDNDDCIVQAVVMPIKDVADARYGQPSVALHGGRRGVHRSNQGGYRLAVHRVSMGQCDEVPVALSAQGKRRTRPHEVQVVHRQADR